MNRFPCSVERVVDGDTFLLGDAYLGFNVRVGALKIRVKDFAAPERGAKGGASSTKAAQALLIRFDGALQISPYEDRMSFERYVCDVWVGDKLFYELMVEQGQGEYTPFYRHKEVWHMRKRGVMRKV